MKNEEVLEGARKQEFIPRLSVNKYFKALKLGLKCLLLLIKPREYLFVGIDDPSRELYAGICPDKTQCSAADFSFSGYSKNVPVSGVQLLRNEKEYKRTEKRDAEIGEKLTHVKQPQTNDKAEWVIRILMDMWHRKEAIQRSQTKADQPLAFHQFL